MVQDFRQYAPATQRNRQPILDVLTTYLPSGGNILEVASGTGEHASFFAPHFAPRLWFPSDPQPLHRLSIDSWRAHCPAANLQPALDLDVQIPHWEAPLLDQDITSLIAINLIHIAPWSAWEGLIRGAAQLLPKDGILYLYGPYRERHKPLAPSNEAFDQSLKSRHPDWGLRELETVVSSAVAQGFTNPAVLPMPANNLSVILQKNV